jgi:hypothetical protein
MNLMKTDVLVQIQIILIFNKITGEIYKSCKLAFRLAVYGIFYIPISDFQMERKSFTYEEKNYCL